MTAMKITNRGQIDIAQRVSRDQCGPDLSLLPDLPRIYNHDYTMRAA